MHTLGAVQNSAPHSTGGFHCTDESDLMCYRDSSSAPATTYPCSVAHEWLLDCNHDDYFHTSPPAGSYLDTHWNVATSVFLVGGATQVSPVPPPTPTTATTTFSGSISSKRSKKTFGLAIGDGSVSSDLEFAVSGGGGGKGKGGGGSGGAPSLRLRVIAPDGSVVLDGTGPSVLRLAGSLPGGDYSWEVSGSSSATFTLRVTYAQP